MTHRKLFAVAASINFDFYRKILMLAQILAFIILTKSLQFLYSKRLIYELAARFLYKRPSQRQAPAIRVINVVAPCK